VGRESNRSAIGARATVIAGGGQQQQEVRGGGSYYSQNDFRLHFGLGDAAAIDKISVRWPNGHEESFSGLALNRLHRLVEGSGQR
jgi:hypothetical protein